MNTDYTKQPMRIRVARLGGIIDDINNELQFSMASPEAIASIQELLGEARALQRSLQQDPGSMTMELD